jgi:FkbM family methyltransferase
VLFKLKLKDRYSIREIHGSKMYLDFQDKGISKDLLKNENREYLSIKTVRSEINPGDIILDIGANIGYYTLLMAKLTREKGKVYAVEPVIQNIELLKKNIKLNKYKNIEVFQLALGNKNKIAPIYISNKRNWHSVIKSELIKNNIIGKALVKMITCDEFLQNKISPDFIRMDVEGYETEIIEGMKKFLDSKKPTKILMEIHDSRGGKREEALESLKNFGFQVKIAICNPILPQLLIQDEPNFIKERFNFLSSKLGIHAPGYFNLNIDEAIHELKIKRKEKWHRWNQLLLERK